MTPEETTRQAIKEVDDLVKLIEEGKPFPKVKRYTPDEIMAIKLNI